jgi:DNA modification methylase
LFQGKVHPTQKTQRLHEVMIEIHTNPGDYVIDPFAGSGVTAFAARALGRKFVVIERDKKYFDELIERLKVENCDKAE